MFRIEICYEGRLGDYRFVLKKEEASKTVQWNVIKTENISVVEE